MLQRLRHAVGWPASAPQQTRFDFQVTARLGHGEMLYVIGDVAALGGSLDVVPKYVINKSETNQITDGIALVTTPELYPVWYNPDSIVLNSGQNIRYKYCVFSGGKMLRYESTPTARSVTVKGVEMTTQDTLDELNVATDSSVRHAVPIVPRLVSGQAFVDRRAMSGVKDGDGRFKLGQRRTLNNSLLGSSIPEEGPDVPCDSLGKMAIAGKVVDSVIDTASKTSGEDVETLSKQVSSPMSSPLVVSRPRATPDESLLDVSIGNTDGVIIVSYRLPVRVDKNNAGEWIIEWDDDNILCPNKKACFDGIDHIPRPCITDGMRITWVGTLESCCALNATEEDALTAALKKFNCVPVFLKGEIATKYHAFSYGTLWPVFHNIVDVYGKLPTRWWNPRQQKDAWSTYTHANRIFVNKVIEVYNEGDLIWLHGVHLMAAPSFIARRLPLANVGFFLHSPFPSSEIFRTLSVREDILRGILSADHIGFHLYEYARHFLTCCRRILGLQYAAQPGGSIGVEYNGRVVTVTISHTGIEPTLMNETHATQSVQDKILELMQEYKKEGKTIIFGLDDLERLSGIVLKLNAIDEFFRKYPEWINKVHIIQVCTINLDEELVHSESVQKTRKEIKALVDQINSTYQPVTGHLLTFFEVEKMSLAVRIPWWTVSDIYFNTAVREAVNLNPFEFIYTKGNRGTFGVTVISEFSGSSRTLLGSLGINPWKLGEIVTALHAALTMEKDEKIARHAKDFEYITSNTRSLWAERVLIDLKRSRREERGEYLGYGLGLGFRMLEFNAGFKKLEIDQVAKSYRTSFRRVILFDYGNTLVTNESNVKDSRRYSLNTYKASKDPHLSHVLQVLCDDPRNTVFVLSGKEKTFLEAALGDVNGLGLAAEHGYFYRWDDVRDRVDASTDWLCSKDNYDVSWRDSTHSIMDIYTQRTHGTYIEVKGSAILWQYRDADPEFGQFQAKELQDHLVQVLEHFAVEVLSGVDYVEVRPAGVDKGAMVDRIISTIESKNDNYVDFILCIGDDTSDEFMFSYLEDNRPRPKLYTCTVGKKPSAAKFFLNDVDEVLELLNSLIKLSTKANRNLSMTDLRRYDEDRSWMARKKSSRDEEEWTSSRSLKQSKLSMSMISLSTAAATGLSSAATSSTLEQYLGNFEESEDDRGGIFF